MPTDCNVLLSSAGRRVALLRLLRRALGEVGVAGRVFATDLSLTAPAFHLADHGVLVPRCTDPAFVDRMLEVCREHRIRLVVPTIDTELAAYAEAAPRFAEIGTLVAISAPEAIRIAATKTLTHAWLTRSGLPTVRQGTPADVLADPDGWRFPLVAKPSAGSNSVGLVRARTLAEIAALPPDVPYVVQTVAPGVEYTVTTFVDRQGRCRVAVPRRRLEVRGGEVNKAITVRLPEVIDVAVGVSEALPGAYGPLNVQIFHDRDSGELNVIEVNARFGGGCPLAIEAGAPSLRWLLEDALGRSEASSGATPAAEWRDGLVMLRFEDAVLVDAAAAGLTPAGWPLERR